MHWETDFAYFLSTRNKYNVSVNNTTLYFIYNKNIIFSGRHVSTFIRSSSGPLGKQILELSIFQCIVESGIWVPTMHWNIDSSRICFPRGPEDDIIKVETCRPDNIIFLLCIKQSQQFIEGKIKGQIEVTRRRGRRRKKLLDDLKDRRGYCQLKEEALDSTMWRNCFGRGFGPVVWQITDDDDDDDLSQDSMRYCNVRPSKRQICFLSPHHPDRVWAQSIHLPKANMGSFPTNKLVVGGKEVKLTLPPNAPALKTREYFPLPPPQYSRCGAQLCTGKITFGIIKYK